MNIFNCDIKVEGNSMVMCSWFGEAFPASAVTPLVLRCHTHALLLTIAKVNIITTSLKVTLRKLVMKRVISLARLAISLLFLPFHLAPIYELIAPDLLVDALSECHQVKKLVLWT
jgi:hypothetical protein